MGYYEDWLENDEICQCGNLACGGCNLCPDCGTEHEGACLILEQLISWEGERSKKMENHVAKEKKWDKLFSKCPGAWLGNSPYNNYQGCIVVNPVYTHHAVRYLNHHKDIEIIECKIHKNGSEDPGICFVIALKNEPITQKEIK